MVLRSLYVWYVKLAILFHLVNRQVNVKKNLDKEGNISHWKMSQKCRIGGMGQCGRKAVSRHCRDVARQQTSVKGHKNFSGCMPGKFFVFAALTLDPG